MHDGENYRQSEKRGRFPHRALERAEERAAKKRLFQQCDARGGEEHLHELCGALVFGREPLEVAERFQHDAQHEHRAESGGEPGENIAEPAGIRLQP